VHPPNQMRALAELHVNSNSAFGLGMTQAWGKWAIIRTSTSKLYFVTGFSVIFADFGTVAACRIQNYSN
jgi:hypothetical protein